MALFLEISSGHRPLPSACASARPVSAEEGGEGQKRPPFRHKGMKNDTREDERDEDACVVTLTHPRRRY